MFHVVAGLAARFLSTGLGRTVAQKATAEMAKGGARGFVAKLAVGQAKFAVNHPLLFGGLTFGPSLIQKYMEERKAEMNGPPDPAELARLGATKDQIDQIMANYAAQQQQVQQQQMQTGTTSAYDPSTDPMLNPNYTGRSNDEIASAIAGGDKAIAAAGDLGSEIAQISAGKSVYGIKV